MTTMLDRSNRRHVQLYKALCPWVVAGLVLLIAPWVFQSGASRSVLTLMAIGIVYALSYNMLLGGTGLLSFGHAVYYGMGGYITMHALRFFVSSGIPFPVELLPLVGGVTGLVFGLGFGMIATRRSGVTFAMISLGIGILMASLAVILRQYFGGAGGLQGDSTLGRHLFGLTLTNRLQVYYFSAAWCAVCMVAIYMLTKTPLGHIANAVRDNPERVQFIGFSPYQVRLRMHALAGLFAGVAGGVLAISTGIVTPDALGLENSASVLMMAYIGGTGIFFGPVIGAVIITYMQLMLSAYTHAWELYIGIFFVLVIMYLPGGIASLIKAHWQVLQRRRLRRLLLPYLYLAIPGGVAALGLIFMVEMAYKLHSVHVFLNRPFVFLGVEFDVHNAWTWVVALSVTVVALAVCRLLSRTVRGAWAAVTEDEPLERRAAQ